MKKKRGYMFVIKDGEISKYYGSQTYRPLSYLNNVTKENDIKGQVAWGRRDRLVKIAEQRVSLPEMEEKMKQLDGIDDVALVALEGEKGPYLGAAVVLSAACDAASPMTPGAKILALRKRLIPLFPKGTVPKRYRFVAELPRNAQGKVQVSALRDLMARDVDKTALWYNLRPKGK